MFAGACFNEVNDCSLRLVRGMVSHCLEEVPARPGLLVQEYEDGIWQTVCPLTDAHFMVDACPAAWDRASRHLRDMIERDEAVTLAAELAALKY